VLSAVNCIERVIPPTNRIAQIVGIDMSLVITAQLAIAAALRSPFTTSTGRNPNRRSTGVVIGFMTRLPTKTAISIVPASNAS